MSRPRSKSRMLAVQAVYQWGLSGDKPGDLLAQFKEYETWNRLDETFFLELVEGVSQHSQAIDEELTQVIDREISRLDLVELALLRLGVYELMKEPSVPYKAVLNEYINLAKVFGSDESYCYINAALDKIARKLRSPEYAS